MTRFADLPAADRAAIRRGKTSTPARGSTTARPATQRPQRARGRLRYRCSRCGHRESAYAAAERHADTHGGARVEIDLEALS